MNKKKKLLSAFGIIIAVILIAYFFVPSLNNRINKKWNTEFVKIGGIIRTYKLAHSKDESPGVGPGNNPIQVKDLNHFSFAILGDTQMFDFPGPSGGYQDAMNQIVKMKPDLVMTVGDLVQDCNTTDKCENYILWKNIAKPILPVTYEVVGNHDRIVGNNELHREAADNAWQKYFNLPTNGPAGYSKFVYSFDVGNSHFVVLDSEKPQEHAIGQDQLDWLSKDLAANQKENTFVFFHEPAFPMSYKVGQSLDVYKDRRDALWAILDKYNVTAVFNGHEHIFSRQTIGTSYFPNAKNNIYQFIIGNTDATEKQSPKIASQVNYYNQGHDFVMVDVNGNAITVRLFSDDGNLVNSFSFSK